MDHVPGLVSPDRAARRRAIALTTGLFVAFEGLHVALAWDGGSLLRGAVPSLDVRWQGPVLWAIYTAASVAAVATLGWWHRTGLARLGRARSIALAAYPLATGAPFVLLGIHIAPTDIVPLVVVGAPLIALNEEIFFRGLILEALRPLGWRVALPGSAILFGASHLVNLIAGANVPFTFMQVAATTAGGVALAAIRIRSGSLWPVIGLHVGLDVMALTTLTGSGVDHPVLVPILMVWLALNLTLWRYGRGLLAGRSEADLDALHDGLPVSTPRYSRGTPAPDPRRLAT